LREVQSENAFVRGKCCRRLGGRASLSFHCRRDAGSTLGFMESLHDLDAAHWDHESVWAIQSAAGPAHSKTWRKCARLWPTRQRLGVRRTSAAFNGSARAEFVWFMESPLSFFPHALDHEPGDRAVASWSAPVLWRFRSARLHSQSARRLAHSKTWRGLRRFMESPHDFVAVHWDLEPDCGA